MGFTKRKPSTSVRPVLVLQLTILLALANGMPLIAKKLLGSRLAWPLDGGLTFIDGRPLLGASKTVRGVVAAVLGTSVAAPLIGLPAGIGAVIGAGAMVGDSVSSFVKRRLALPPSSRATGLDQILEALFPALACRALLPLTAWDIVVVVAVFFVGEIVVSRALYRAHLRDRPY